MGWLFKNGYSRKELIEDRTKDWERTTDGMAVRTTRLAHCYRGGAFAGVLWTVWERTFTRDGVETQPTELWIGCDLLRYQKDFGWGYKDMEESCHPYYYSCPLKYLNLVPIEQFGGHEEWRANVRQYHARQQAKRKLRTPATSVF
jgi:hypothetical protein